MGRPPLYPPPPDRDVLTELVSRLHLPSCDDNPLFDAHGGPAALVSACLHHVKTSGWLYRRGSGNGCGGGWRLGVAGFAVSVVAGGSGSRCQGFWGGGGMAVTGGVGGVILLARSPTTVMAAAATTGVHTVADRGSDGVVAAAAAAQAMAGLFVSVDGLVAAGVAATAADALAGALVGAVGGAGGWGGGARWRGGSKLRLGPPGRRQRGCRDPPHRRWIAAAVVWEWRR